MHFHKSDPWIILETLRTGGHRMFIIIGILAGFLAGKILRGRGYGLLGNLLIGLIGSYVGEFLFNTLDLNTVGTLGSLLMSTVGAIVFLYIMQLFRR